MIRFCVEIELLLESEEYTAIPMSVASHSLLLPFYIYLFVFPCVIASGISGNCAGKIHIMISSHDHMVCTIGHCPKPLFQSEAKCKAFDQVPWLLL